MKRRVLIVAIDGYHPRIGRLGGCANDADDFGNLLESRFTFSHDEIRHLRDNEATRQAILEGLTWLVDDVSPGDVSIFFYAGHGTQLQNPADPSGLDEALIGYSDKWDTLLADQPSASILFEQESWELQFIRDKEIKQILDAAPEGVSLTLVLDCCHSGHMHRLPESARLRFVLPPLPVQEAILAAQRTFWTKYRQQHPNSPISKPDAGNRFEYSGMQSHGVVLAACGKDQRALEMGIAGIQRGLFSYHLCSQLRSMPSVPTYGELIDAIGKGIQPNRPNPWLICQESLKTTQVFAPLS